MYILQACLFKKYSLQFMCASQFPETKKAVYIVVILVKVIYLIGLDIVPLLGFL